MSTSTDNLRTIHLPTDFTAPAGTAQPAARKGLRLTDLRTGETCRILRITLPDSGCRKRFAELGLAQGMKVTIASTGDTLMLIVGSSTNGGNRMALASRCAEEIIVSRIPS